ncbi:hypothetical protein K431DRAFT_298499 [Polychaeton citri CBS 116435]|uniref:Uncharacterized protein n=1 Tax=Polychaeton citri CBS 116435 TaxID=1314669 RepID=A0A9P4Q1B8_9PEZI|nr:hypothetical protein K431DRAFT_298499 [Polychaeton citri CBS 116435]
MALVSIALGFSTLVSTFVSAYNTPPTFEAGTHTCGMVQQTITTTPGYKQGETNCWCGPTQIPDYIDAVHGFLNEYCGGAWSPNNYVQQGGAASFVVDSTVVLLKVTPESNGYFPSHAANDVRPIDCFTISEFLNSASAQGNPQNGCGADMSFSCEVWTTFDANGEYGGPQDWGYQIGAYAIQDQFWVTGNLDGIDPTNGEAYGGANLIAGAQAAQFYPTLERLEESQFEACAQGGSNCANNFQSPNAFADPEINDTNPCAGRRSLNISSLPRALRFQYDVAYNHIQRAED